MGGWEGGEGTGGVGAVGGRDGGGWWERRTWTGRVGPGGGGGGVRTLEGPDTRTSNPRENRKLGFDEGRGREGEGGGGEGETKCDSEEDLEYTGQTPRGRRTTSK